MPAILFICMIFLDSPFKTFTLSPKTPKSDYPFYPTSIIPRKPEETIDDNASTSARGIALMKRVLLI